MRRGRRGAVCMAADCNKRMVRGRLLWGKPVTSRRFRRDAAHKVCAGAETEIQHFLFIE